MHSRIRFFNKTDSWEYGHDSGAEERPLEVPKKRRAVTAMFVAFSFAGGAVAALADGATTSSTDGTTASTTTVSSPTTTAASSDAAPASPAPTQAPATADAITPAQEQATDSSPAASAPAAPTASAPAQQSAPSASPNSSDWTVAPAARTAPLRVRTSHLAPPSAWVSTRPSRRKARSNRSLDNTWVSAGTAKSGRIARRATGLHAPGSAHDTMQALATLPSVNVGPWLFDRPAGPIGDAAVTLAQRLLGIPYVWGGASPYTGFDCSGLTQFIYAQLGIPLPHYAAAQWNVGRRISPGQLEPGDLVFFEPRFDGPGHVGIYIGDDEFIAAPRTGAVVSIGSLSDVANAIGFVGAVRPDPAVADEQRALVRMTTNRPHRPPLTDGIKVFLN